MHASPAPPAQAAPAAESVKNVAPALDERRAGFWLVLLYLLAVLLHFLPSLLFPAHIAIYNDEITYKTISRDLWESGTIERAEIYRTNVPPLYPLLLAPFHALGDPMLIHRAQAFATMAVYFLALFPAFWLARRLLPPGPALAAAGLLILSPQTVYSAWLMSGNLFFPLFAFFLWFAFRMGESPGSNVPVALTGFALAGCILTRLSGLQALAILLLLGILRAASADRVLPRLRVFARHLRAAASSILIVLPIWIWLGYFGPGGLHLEYQPATPEPVSAAGMAGLFGYWFGINVFAWFLGVGIVPAVLALIACCRGSSSAGFRDLRRLFLVTLLVLITGAAWVCVGLVRALPEYWHPVTRYTYYAAPLLWPLAVAGLVFLHERRSETKVPAVALFVLVAAVFLMLLALHGRFQDAERWFGDAPDLQIYQTKPADQYEFGFRDVEAVLLPALLILLATGLSLKYPRGAFLVLAILLVQMKVQTYAQHNVVLEKHAGFYDSVRNIALAMEREKVPELPVVVEDYDDMNRPLGNLWFWTRRYDLYRQGVEFEDYLELTRSTKEAPMLLRDGDWRLYRIGHLE